MDPITLALLGGAPGAQNAAVGQALAGLGAQNSQPQPGTAGAASSALSGLSTGLGQGLQQQGIQQLLQFLKQPRPPLGALQMGQGEQGIQPLQNGGLQWGG